ncbi:MAG: SurA N-terminal domain-containing protein [Methylocella sp.]
MRNNLDARGIGGVAGVWFKACLVIVAATVALIFGGGQGHAQAIVASINGDPITDIDIDQRMKLLRVLRKPATRDAAIESLFTDHLENRETWKFGVVPRDEDITQQIIKTADEMKIQPQALVAAIQGAGVTSDHFKAHFRAEFAFDLLVQALNKGVEASEEQVRAEIAKQGGKAAAGTEYTVRQVIFTLPSAATPAAMMERGREAEQLRGKFTSCDTGLPLARAINDVTVREPLTRTSLEINEGLRQLLDKTPVGHLTAPQRSSSGLEMIALCNKGPAKDDTAARTVISQKLLASHIAEDRQRRLKELRDRAVVVKTGS